jgi:hypothetical protein
MNLFGLFRNPAKRYARELGPWLRKSYGPSSDYTEGQIRRGVLELRLDEQFIGLGYAGFMKQETFESFSDRMPVKFSYEEARAKLERFAKAPVNEWPSGAGESMVSTSEVAAGMDFHSN